MAILQKLKSLLGFDDSDSERGGAREVGVTVEREGSTNEGSAVDAGRDETEDRSQSAGTAEPPQSATAGSSSAGSTESVTEPTDSPAEAAEPAEATGPETEDAAPTTEKTPDQPAEPSPIEEAESETDTAAEPETEEPEPEPESEPEVEPESEPEPEPEPEPADAESSAEAESDEADQESVDSIKGIGPAYADRLADAGVETVGELAAADAAELADETDISETRIQGWIDRAEVR